MAESRRAELANQRDSQSVLGDPVDTEDCIKTLIAQEDLKFAPEQAVEYAKQGCYPVEDGHFAHPAGSKLATL